MDSAVSCRPTLTVPVMATLRLSNFASSRAFPRTKNNSRPLSSAHSLELSLASRIPVRVVGIPAEL
jgi:hypothetical protein